MTQNWLAIAALLICSPVVGQDAGPRAGDAFENVTVLHDMPAEQMGKVMNIMSAALGVGCTHCHAGYEFAKEGVANKAKAREMITMTFALNKDKFKGQTEVTCMTCHQGHARPLDPAVNATAAHATEARPPYPPIVPLTVEQSLSAQRTVEQVLDRYRQAMHGDKTNPSPAAFEWAAVRIEPNGKQEREIIKLSPPSAWQVVTHYGQLAVTERFQEGVVAKLARDKPIALKPDEAAHIRIEATIALGSDLKSLFPNWTMASPVSIDQQAMHVLRATHGQLTHQFYFDQQTGRLRRRTSSLPTVLGSYVTEVDYDDYQSLDGRLVPTKTHFRMPSVSWERRLNARQ